MLQTIPANAAARQHGLALGIVLLVIALLAALAVALMLVGRQKPDRDAQAQVYASAILAQAHDVQAGFDAMAARGIELESVGFGNVAGTDLFNPAAGILERPRASHAAAESGVMLDWQYRQNTILEGAGSGASDYFIGLSGLTRPVCQEINRTVLGTTTIPQTAVAAATLANFANTAVSLDFSTDTSDATLGRREACLATFDGKYVYYRLILAR